MRFIIPPPGLALYRRSRLNSNVRRARSAHGLARKHRWPRLARFAHGMLCAFGSAQGVAMELLAVFTTVSNEQEAEALALGAIERELAACVQAESIHSTYRWKGGVEHSPRYACCSRQRAPSTARSKRIS